MNLRLCLNTGAWPRSTFVLVVIRLCRVLLLRARTHTHTCVYEIRYSCGDEYKDYGCFGCEAVLCGKATLCLVSED